MRLDIALKLLLGILVLAIAAIVIPQGAEIAAKLGNHIMSLFREASLVPGSRGFTRFLELIFIAVFVGWAINRIRKTRRRK